MSAAAKKELPRAYLRSHANVVHKELIVNHANVVHKELGSRNKLIADKILDATTRGYTKNSPEMCLSSDTTLTNNLLRMKVVNCATAEEEDIIIEFPWDPKSLISTVAQATDLAFGRHVLVMALKRFCGQSNLRKILTIKGLPTCTIRENPYLCPGHLPYNNFVDSLIEFLGIGNRSGARNLAMFGKD